MMKKVVFLVLLLLSFSCLAIDSVKINEDNGLFAGFDKTLPITSAKYLGWAANWKWAGAKVRVEQTKQKNTEQSAYFIGEVKDLGIMFNGGVFLHKQQFNWVYLWDKSSNISDAIGFGIEFDLKLNSPTFASASSDPELLPENKGWRWQTPDGQWLEVQFAPALAELYFERGQKNKIRALFFKNIETGAAQTQMTVSVSQKVALSPGSAIDYDIADLNTWHENILPATVSPLDLSFLNKAEIPAGKRGFIKAKADKLVFADGSEVKFWGTNIMAYTLFQTSDADIKLHAKRLSQLGFNLVRIHHHDSIWVKPNIFKEPKINTLELSESSLKKLDWWIKCLKDEGIYIWLDLHVGRNITENDYLKYDDNLDSFYEFSKKKPQAEIKGFNYYNPSIKALMLAFNKAYLSHVNEFTKLAYKDDPAFISLLITNENDLTQHFGNALLPDKGVPIHNKIFSQDAKQFADKYNLSYDKTWRTWEMGESKLYLNDVEHRFNQDMIGQLQQLGFKALIATTSSWGRMGLFGLPSLTDGSIIDAHSYGRAEELKYNPRYNPGFLSWIAGSQVSGKPLSVTEWNIEPFPAADRFTAPLFTASIANLQGWDAMMLYGYSQSPLGGQSKGSNYSSFNDPAIMGLMLAAALMYRQGHVSAAKQSYELKLNKQDFFFKRQDPTTAKTIRTLLETSRLSIAIPKTPELSWLKDSGKVSENTIIIDDPNKDFIPAAQNFVESDTKELKRDWVKGIQTINTPKSQVVSGWIGGEKIKLNEVIFNIKTKVAVVSVQSLENKPIKESNRLFITAMARSEPDKQQELVFLSEPVQGEIMISAPKGLKLYLIGKTGKKSAAMPVSYQDGQYQLMLNADMQNHWLVLEK